ncbi:MAG: hypothetical protein U9R42_13615 [Bacteroidota bacterium]|nr:hypothetical protein [Bacteroidota bacterium]
MIGQNREAAIISDKDDYTIIRNGEGIEYDSLSFIKENEIFYVDNSGKQWERVYLFKFVDGKQITGFVHKSRIQTLKECSLQKKVEILNMLNVQLTENNEKFKNNKSDFQAIERDYDPYSELTENYFCETGDTNILKKFFTVKLSLETALEEPSVAVANCFVCRPELVIGILKSMNRDIELLISDIIAYTPSNIENYKELIRNIKELKDMNE